MSLRTSDIVPISEARARLTELAEDVVGAGSEKVLTDDAITALRQALAGQFVTDDQLDRALGVEPPR